MSYKAAIALLLLAASALSTIAISVGQYLEVKRETGSPDLVSGVVKNYYTCPPCPPKALCKPCGPNFLVLQDANQPDKEIRILLKGQIPSKKVPKKGFYYTIMVVKTPEGKIEDYRPKKGEEY